MVQSLQDKKSFSAASLREMHRKSSSILWDSRPFCGIQRTGGGRGSEEVRMPCVEKVGEILKYLLRNMYTAPMFGMTVVLSIVAVWITRRPADRS